MVLVIDIETTGLKGYPKDRVLEIGFCEYCPITGEITPVYNSLIRYDDIVEFDAEYINDDGSRRCWIYRNSDMALEDTLHAEKSLDEVVSEVRELVKGKLVTSYNTDYDFGKFLFHEPWNLQDCCIVPYDIMDLATNVVKQMYEQGEVPEGDLLDYCRSKKWDSDEKFIRSVRAIISYRLLCPDDPASRNGVQSHRAMDDAIQEAWILKRVVEMSSFSGGSGE